MKGWLLIETLLVLLVANAIVRFVVAMGREMLWLEQAMRVGSCLRWYHAPGDLGWDA